METRRARERIWLDRARVTVRGRTTTAARPALVVVPVRLASRILVGRGLKARARGWSSLEHSDLCRLLGIGLNQGGHFPFKENGEGAGSPMIRSQRRTQ